MLSPPPVTVYDNLLAPEHHRAVLAYLSQPGWSYGGYSDPQGDRYFYKHFAGFVRDGAEAFDAPQIEAELERSAPILAQLWRALTAGPLKGQILARCYANALPAGVEGSLHTDSNVSGHLTAIYYPHLNWDPNLGGETLLFNAPTDDVIAAIYPKPNRLAVFDGSLPHVARPLSRRSRDLRVTLMFKTMPGGDPILTGEGGKALPEV